MKYVQFHFQFLNSIGWSKHSFLNQFSMWSHSETPRSQVNMWLHTKLYKCLSPPINRCSFYTSLNIAENLKNYKLGSLALEHCKIEIDNLMMVYVNTIYYPCEGDSSLQSACPVSCCCKKESACYCAKFPKTWDALKVPMSRSAVLILFQPVSHPSRQSW